ncbi:TPA: hypothetical protein DF272_06430 [Candidatus Falkowbacteria bacterium]|nr:hypothetical protein [Candidatus Falkowbacteria bacterium]
MIRASLAHFFRRTIDKIKRLPSFLFTHLRSEPHSVLPLPASRDSDGHKGRAKRFYGKRHGDSKAIRHNQKRRG